MSLRAVTRPLIVFAILACAAQAPRAADLLDVSSFMMPPRQSWAQIADSQNPDVVVTEKLADKGGVGFRILHMRTAVKGRKQAAIDLAKSKIVETGDILLSFRPLWDRTLAYAHMQLGVSHSGIAFIVSDGNDKMVMTLESPISYSSPLNAPEHYSDLDAIHIIRPNLSDPQKVNLEKWAKLILSRPEKFDFYSDYSLPMYKRGNPGVSSPVDEILYLAKISTGASNASFASYCSEFVWSLLGLRNCDPTSFGAGCIKPIFQTSDGMLTGIVPGLENGSGFVQGPETAVRRGGFKPTEGTTILTKKVFVDVLSDPSELAGRMSAGHRKVAEDNSENMKLLNGFYASGEPAPLAQAINQSVANNVSPTSFLIRSNAGMDGFHYVGTVVFDR
ncbi:hypothetical protein ACCS43_20205 [Rhizobium ruizarguesonis]